MTEQSPRKLRKKVSFALSPKTSNVGDHPKLPVKTSWWKKNDSGKEKKRSITPPTPLVSPKSKSAGWLSRFSGNKAIKADQTPNSTLPTPHNQAIPSVPIKISPITNDTSETWHHHDRYFPSFTDADINALSPPPPIATISLYSEASQVLLETQAKEQSAASGREVVVHYPDIPAFKEYLKTRGPEAIAWGEAKWGMEGWQGYGWGDVVIPDAKPGGAAKGGGGGAQPQGGGGGGKGKGKGGGGGETAKVVETAEVVVVPALDVINDEVLRPQHKVKEGGGEEKAADAGDSAPTAGEAGKGKGKGKNKNK